MSLTSRLVAIASQRFPRLSRHVLASSGYTLDLGAFGPDAFRLWDRSTAERQNRAWLPLVEQAKAGHPREDIAALWGALDALDPVGKSVLEVGCGGGYNSELITSRYRDVHYKGLDLSDSMIAISRERYPEREFLVGSAVDLPFEKGSIDIVLDGVALLHIPDWKVALAEYARVARSAVILHGLTLSAHPTVAFGKYAYGQPSREYAFNRAEVLTECESVGLSLTATFANLDYDLDEYIGIPSVSETWLMAKR